MDFLVVGLGLGALSILSGITMVTLVVWRWQRATQRATLPEEQRYFVACAASRNAAGQALIAAGAAILLATIGAVAGSLDDRTGSLLVATTATVAALGLIVRDFLYRSRNPMPRRPRSRALEAPVAATPTRTAPLVIAPIAVEHSSDSQEETPELDEAMAATGEGPALDAELDLGAAVEMDVAVADAELSSVPEEAAANPVAETNTDTDTDAVIDVPYSFMQDDDPASGARTAPYSFMAADDLREASAAAASRNGAEAVNDTPGGNTPRGAKPPLRLVGKQRARMP